MPHFQPETESKALLQQNIKVACLMAFGVKLIYVIFYVKTETCCNVEGGKTLVSGSDNEATQDNTESETESQAWAGTGERWHTCHTSI